MLNCAPVGLLEFDSTCDKVVTLADAGLRAPPVKAAMSGCATHDLLLIASTGPNDAWLTTRGPYVANPPLAAMPLAGISLSVQYEPAPDPWRGVKMPVMSKLTSALVARSRSRRTSPSRTSSSAAAEAGMAAGIARVRPLPAAVGHWPAMRTA
ncbi:MAG: hypothetical protein JWM19_2411 [Actinomycetia bacterium]|nr:hypothetical protein [Actinomycetes bacterium]